MMRYDYRPWWKKKTTWGGLIVVVGGLVAAGLKAAGRPDLALIADAVVTAGAGLLGYGIADRVNRMAGE